MRREHREAQLYLNGRPVGTVQAEASSDAWGWGTFTPSEEFSRFATLFGSWSLLIHEDDDRDRSSYEVLDELRAAEIAIDRIKAELAWTDSQERTPLRQLTIDGSLIEWNLGMM